MLNLMALDELLDVDWRPQAESGALAVLERCASPLEAAYLLGVPYYLERASRLSMLLLADEVDGQPGLWIADPWPGWALPGKTPVRAPMALLLVPQYRHHDGQQYTFGVFYGLGSDTPRWRLEYLVQLEPPRALTIEGRQQRFKSVNSRPESWWKAIVLLEVALK